MKPDLILLVEDDPDDEALTLRAFRRHRPGARVVVARDGLEALRLLFSGEGLHPAVILLDIGLPGLDGVEVLRRIREERSTRRTPVVMFTASGRRGDVDRSYDLGANSCVRKPVEVEAFTEAVALMGRYWLELNEVADV